MTDIAVEHDVEPARMLEVGDLRLRVLHTNVGSGQPLLLINGIGAPIEMWQPFVDELDDRELIRIDLPGCGLSSAPRRPLRLLQKPEEIRAGFDPVR